MSRRKQSAVARLALALACASALSPCYGPAGSAQEARPAPARKPSQVFQEARAVNGDASPEPEAFEFELKGSAFHVRRNGNGRRTKGERTRGFNLRLDSGDFIARLFYSEFEGGLLLLLHLGDEGGGAGLVTRLEQPSMRGLWRQRIAASDIGRPLREGPHLYVTGVGLVGKLDLRTGEYAWLHDGLEDARGAGPRALNAFDPPELKGDAVLFRERPVYNPRRTVVVSKKTGEVLRIE